MSDNYFKKLFIDDVKSILGRGNTEQIAVTDSTTGKEYVVYVLDGKLMMKEQGEG